MDEDEFRSTYHAINPDRCVYEKAINSRICNCSKSQRFNLADREGVSCMSDLASRRCSRFLQEVRTRSRFVLKIGNVEESLPHGIEIKLQNGGLLGLRNVIEAQGNSEQKVNDIFALLDAAGQIDELPYNKIVESVAEFQARKRGSSNRCK